MADLAAARAALAAGQRDEARRLLMAAARENPANGEVWHLLSQAVDSDAQRLDCESRAAALGYTPPPAAPMRPCPRCAEPNPAGANFCSRCALAFNAPPPPIPTYPQPMPPPARRIPWSSMLIFAGALGLLLTCALILNSTSQRSRDGLPSEAGAIATCRAAVRRQLSAPATATFTDERTSAGEHGNYVVLGQVAAQQGLGNTVRQSWVCRAVWAGSAYQAEGVVLS
jgi:hypothetical protein